MIAGKAVLDEEDVRRAWFQLVDSYTDSLDASDYAEWVHKTLSEVTTWSPGQTRACCWQSDSSIFGRLSATHKLSQRERATLKLKRQQWESRFGAEEVSAVGSWAQYAPPSACVEHSIYAYYVVCHPTYRSDVQLCAVRRAGTSTLHTAPQPTPPAPSVIACALVHFLRPCRANSAWDWSAARVPRPIHGTSIAPVSRPTRGTQPTHDRAREIAPRSLHAAVSPTAAHRSRWRSGFPRARGQGEQEMWRAAPGCSRHKSVHKSALALRRSCAL